MHKQFVLLSGGLDSSTLLYHAYFNQPLRAAFTDEPAARLETEPAVEAISIDYGQRHGKEIAHAVAIAAGLQVPHYTLELPGLLLGSMLTSQADIPEVAYSELPDGISPTYVPFRNGLMLSMLAAVAQKWVGTDTRKSATIYIGAHAEDAERDAYPDCSQAFLDAMGKAIYIGTYGSVSLDAPFVGKTKAEIVAYAALLGVPLDKTWSCYKGKTFHCGVCPTCRARKEAFKVAGVNDPTRYAAD